jgi:hypothetical protein
MMKEIFLMQAAMAPVKLLLRCAFARLRAEQGRNPFIVLFNNPHAWAPLRIFASLRETKKIKPS